MNRIVVVGSSGSGKTTVAQKLADALDIPHLEMDAVMHDGSWNATSDNDFCRALADFAAGERWVIDGNYTSHGARDTVWPRADTVIWLDPPKRVVMSRVIRRTLRRIVTREELWGGLREPLGNLHKTDPLENIILWAWTRYEHVQRKFEAAMTDGTWDHASVHRLRSPREVGRLFDEPGSADPEPGHH